MGMPLPLPLPFPCLLPLPILPTLSLYSLIYVSCLCRFCRCRLYSLIPFPCLCWLSWCQLLSPVSAESADADSIYSLICLLPLPILPMPTLSTCLSLSFVSPDSANADSVYSLFSFSCLLSPASADSANSVKSLLFLLPLPNLPMMTILCPFSFYFPSILCLLPLPILPMPTLYITISLSCLCRFCRCRLCLWCLLYLIDSFLCRFCRCQLCLFLNLCRLVDLPTRRLADTPTCWLSRLAASTDMPTLLTLLPITKKEIDSFWKKVKTIKIISTLTT